MRLRYVLALALLGGAVWSGYPRVRATWELHDLASKTADYAACMAGPTGPELIRDHLTEFRRVVRRRLVAAQPDEAPFRRCAKLAAIVVGSPDAERQHAAPAAAFVEYGAATTEAPSLALASLLPDLKPLAEKARDAWPFVRGGFARLVRPSLSAREAVHPVAPPRPSVGRGLPSDRALPKRAARTSQGLVVSVGEGANLVRYLSVDQGLTFKQVGSGDDREFRGGCGGKDPERGFGLSSREDGSLLVTSFGPNREPSTVTAVAGEHLLVAVACDDTALVLAAQPEGKDAVELSICAHERTCTTLRPPPSSIFAQLSGDRFDLARVASTTVLAVEQGGIVRVVSTRDDGRTWTPPVVAFDAAEAAPLKTDIAAPTRLLAVGSRLFLYGAARRAGQTYPLLVSDDQGASFRAPETSDGAVPAAPVAQRR